MRIRFASFAVALTLLAAGLAVVPMAVGSGQAATGTAESRLTSWGDVLSWQFSPDGSRVAALRSAGEAPPGSGWLNLADLWEVNLAGGQPAALVRGVAATGAAYSPNGDAIAFFRPGPGGDWRLSLLQSGQVRDLGAADPSAPPQWSADGQRLSVRRAGKAIAVDRQGVVVPGVLAPDSSGAGRLSPDGARRATLVSADASSELWVERADGSDRRLLLRAELELMGAPAWSPDGSLLVLSRTPNGSETANYSELWLVRADGSDVTRLTRNQQSEEQPAFSPDGKRLGFLRAGDLWLRGLTPDAPPAPKPAPVVDRSKLTPPPSLESLLAPRVTGALAPQLAGALTPPVTIYVSHTVRFNTEWHSACPNGGYPGPITAYPFEQYLKYVVPSEVSASWPPEALKAQAVAARTYAWDKILWARSIGRAWDVTDYTDYQFMCPSNLDDRSSAAVDATQGQYASYGGKLITAMYSAENSDPTRSATPEGTVLYLMGVDDPVGFGQTQRGHGMGMSQWGAYRWAGWYGWNYQQILTHYYTGITVQLPAGSSPDHKAPLASPVAPWPGWYVNSNRAALAANASDDSSGVASTSYTARYYNGSAYVTTGVTPLFDLTSLPDQWGIQITATVRDGANNVGTGMATWSLDRAAPSGWAVAPVTSTGSTVNLLLSASDAGPSGIEGVVLSNNWKWEAEGGSYGLPVGTVVSDPGALNGAAWKGTTPAGRLFGPFVTLPNGAYRAWFRLKAANVLTTNEVAFLEVIDNGDCYDPNDDPAGGCTNNAFKRLGMKRVRGVDFRQAGEYQEFFVDFNVSNLVGALEFPLWFRATSDLWFDRVMVTTFPTSMQASMSWTLLPGEGVRTAQVRYVDYADNISPDYPVTTTVGPPVFLTADSIPWQTTRTPTITVTAQDLGSGLDLATAAYRYSNDGGLTWNAFGWLPATTSPLGGSATASLTAFHVPFGQDGTTANRLEFKVADVAGGETIAGYTVPIDTVAPTAAATAPAFTPGSPVTVNWAGSDFGSGLVSYDVQSRVGDGPWTPWLTATTATSAVFPGTVGQAASFRARATDAAGNKSAYRDGNGDAWTAVGGTAVSIPLPAGWTLLAAPFRPAVVDTAEELAQSIGASEVASWQNSAWVSHLAGLSPNDFDLQPGQGYFVRLARPAVWQAAGFTVDPGFTVTLSAGWNLVSAPQGKGPFTAASLAESIAASGAGPRFILRWRAGAWGMYGVGLGGQSFAVDPAAAYFVFCDAPRTWTP